MTTWVDCNGYEELEQEQEERADVEKKVEVIEHVKKNLGLGSRNIAEAFECGKMQIQSILLHINTIVAKYKGSGLSSERKWHHTAEYTEVNDAVYKWYCLARQWCVPVSVPLLQEEACRYQRK